MSIVHSVDGKVLGATANLIRSDAKSSAPTTSPFRNSQVHVDQPRERAAMQKFAHQIAAHGAFRRESGRILLFRSGVRLMCEARFTGIVGNHSQYHMVIEHALPLVISSAKPTHTRTRSHPSPPPPSHAITRTRPPKYKPSHPYCHQK